MTPVFDRYWPRTGGMYCRRRPKTPPISALRACEIVFAHVDALTTHADTEGFQVHQGVYRGTFGFSQGVEIARAGRLMHREGVKND